MNQVTRCQFDGPDLPEQMSGKQELVFLDEKDGGQG